MLKGNVVIGQSGGPTSVINSSLVGVVDGMNKANVGTVYGMKYGIEGFLNNQFVDLSAVSDSTLLKLRATPSSALGSSRYKLQEKDFPQILEVLKKNDIRYFFLIGGNDSMDTVNRVESYCRNNGYELVGVGVPKTVDNDLYGTDHTPGFISAARSNILNVKQSGVLAKDMQKVDKFVIYQTIGRDAGWLAGATALAQNSDGDAPHLIYMPEKVFDAEKFLRDVDNTISKNGWVSIVCGEGIKYANGSPVSSTEVKDSFNNVEFGAMGGGSVAMNLHKMISNKLDVRGEFQITESLIMCAYDRASKRDLQEAYECGLNAAELAKKGETGYMVSMQRVSNAPYTIKYGQVLLNDVAIKAKPMPEDYFNSEGNYVSEKFMEYMLPLMEDENFPEFVSL